MSADRISFVNGGDGALALDHEVVVFFGDLNYRINLTNERARELVVEKVNFFFFSPLFQNVSQMVKVHVCCAGGCVCVVLVCVE